jgi:hypothetical protein
VNGIWYSEVEAFWREACDPAMRALGFEVEAVHTVCRGAWKRFYSAKDEPFWLYFYVEVKDPGCSGLHVVPPRHLGIGERVTAYFTKQPQMRLEGLADYPLNRAYLEKLFEHQIESFNQAKERIRDNWAPPGDET